MTDDFRAEFPEAAEYIMEAVEENGEEWVLDNYYSQFYPLGVMMEIPDKEELPFFDEEQHDTLEKEELIKMAEMRRAYIKNLQSAGQKEDESERSKSG